MRSGWFTNLIASIFTRVYYLQQNNFLNLSVRDSVNVSTVIPAQTFGKQGEIKTVSGITGLLHSLGP